MPRKRVPARETSTNSKRTSARTSSKRRDDVPIVYQDMLAEAALAGPHDSFVSTSRAMKRRKVTPAVPKNINEDDRMTNDAIPPTSPEVEWTSDQPVVRRRQVIYDDSSDTSDSNIEFEDVELEPIEGAPVEDSEPSEEKPLLIDLSTPAENDRKRPVQRRKPVSRAERNLRLDVHKWHILCLLLHVQCRNRWCESEEVQAILKPLVSRKVISLLHLEESKPQFQRAHSFNKGIEELSALWRSVWQVTARGLRRAFWKEDIDISKEADELEDPVEFEDFKTAARIRSGSRDVGAQLFCALLRSVAVETRLVFSLQPLPFSGTAKGQTSEKAKPKYVYAPPQTYTSLNATQPEAATETNPRWRMSEHASSPRPQTATSSMTRKKIRDSPYPIFWVEVFSPAATLWIPVDSLVRHTINKPKTGYEPPASDTLNSMSYVVAFEDDGSAKDVTRRYVQFPNAKTRKLRVESTKGGPKWWNRTISRFRKLVREDRDIIEDADLAKREAAEPMPRNVQDFKGHPIYVLERHLRQNEVIHPKREAGKVGTGVSKGRDGKLESIYRRKDVHVVRSADQWYRRGRDVKDGEVGLKRRQTKKDRHPSDDEGSEAEQDDGTMLYAEFQTNIYVPPPVVRRRIPKNAYGNLDVYVPSMIPPGAIHVQHPEAANAAKVLELHYADAVTGFDFKGRQGTAVLNGIVVAEEYRDAVVEVIEAIEYERIHTEEERRSLMMLQLWKRFMIALRIRQKVDRDYGGDDEEKERVSADDDDDDDDADDGTYQDESDGDAGGGFVPEAGDAEDTDTEAANPPLALLPTFLPHPEALSYREVVVVESPHIFNLTAERTPPMGDQVQVESHEPGGFMAENEVDAEMESGGFLVEDDNQEPVGFLIEDLADDDSDDIQRTTAAGDAMDFSLSRYRGTGSRFGDLEEADRGEALPLRAPSLPPGSSSNGQRHSPLVEPDQVELHHQEPPQLQPGASQNSLFNDDNISLMSHDPADDDAEPDWLADSD